MKTTFLVLAIAALSLGALPASPARSAGPAQETADASAHPFVAGQRYQCLLDVSGGVGIGMTVEELLGGSWLAVSDVTFSPEAAVDVMAEAGFQAATLHWLNAAQLTLCAMSEEEDVAAPAGQTDSPIFQTPDEVIAHYVEGIARNDVNRILQAAAGPELGESFQFDRSVERLGGVMMLMQSLAPSDYPFYAEINQLYLSSQILSQVKLLAYSLLSDEEVDGSSLFEVDAERVKRFIAAVDPAGLAGLEVETIALPNETLMNDERYLKNMALMAAVNGADEATERVALLSFAGRHYVIGFTLLRYGETWKISNQSSPLAGMNSLGTPGEITADEFAEMIGGQ